MIKSENKKEDLALDALLEIFSILLYKFNLPSEKVIDFIDSNDKLKNIYNETDALVCMLHDNTLEDFANSIGEKLNA